MPEEDKRDAYRIEYEKRHLEPTLVIDNEFYRVVDLSTDAIKYYSSDANIGDKVNGNIVLHNGEVQPIEGIISRAEKDRRVVSLDVQLPIGVIKSEMKYVTADIYKQPTGVDALGK